VNEQRRGHPYHTYDAILAQPEAFGRVLEKNGAAVDEFATSASPCGRLFIVGIGTSYHAARVGEHLFREYGGGLDVRAVHSFDFALYGPELGPGDCVVGVSHRGTKRYTALALGRAIEAGCRTALVTGNGSVVSLETDAVFRTVEQERSSAHTVSYTTAVSILAHLAERIGYHRTSAEVLSTRSLHEELPAALREALGVEEQVKSLAREHVDRRRIWLLGGGPSAVTAEEVALKIKETSYMQAEGMSTETMLHGPFQCVEAEDLFVLIAPAGAAQERTLEVAELVDEVGGAYLIVGDGEASETVVRLAVQEVPEPFSALTCLLPLQLFAYYLALSRGTNPDAFRTDDPRFARADVSGRL
jgi:glucosamine--fructose-6-phosphate aminotransferase (isomerizing)